MHKGEYGNVILVGSLSYTDTPQGRYALVRSADYVGRSHISVIPIDINGLRRRLRELLATDTR